MQEIKITCDKCKTENICKSLHNSGFKKVTLGFGQYNKKEYDLCPDCLKKYGLINQDNGEKNVSEQNTADKLYEVIAEIVAENTESVGN